MQARRGARGAVFSDISLTGFCGHPEHGGEELFRHAGFGAISAMITQPVFHGGANLANSNLADAQADQIARY